MPDRIKILIVDDEPPVCTSIASALAGGGYHIDTVNSGAEALKRDGENRYDVIVADLMMPGISGIDLLKAVKKKRPEAIVIMVTGYPSIKTAVQSVKLGAFDYIPKPFAPDEIRALVARALVRKKLFEEEHVGADSVHEVPIPDGTYAIADNSWARLEEDGHVRVGIHHIFLRILGSIESIEFPAIGEQVYQGEACVRIVDEKGRSHRLWAPVTGRVATVNNEISEDLSVLFDNPYLDGWMLLFAPSYLDKDLENLQRIG